ncbi:hypothetical protein BGX27_008771 [Mortierella sp. AM989]|nr:hypothetical protein BGX27_008771 [Mortierella sp. AM989]
MDTEQKQNPVDTILGTLRTMTELASGEAILSSSSDPSLKDGSPYGFFLGVEKTPANIIFGNAIIVGLLLQPVLFYGIWALCPSLTKNRRGLSWVLTFCCACTFLGLTLCEFGYVRITLWSLFGWEVQGPEAATATIFTYWTPLLHNWIQQYGYSSNSSSSPVTLSMLHSSLTNMDSLKQILLKPQTYKGLTGEYLRWFISLPIFSLAPLKPTIWYSPTAPYYLGGGGRILFSLENFPRENWFSSAVGGYFIAYCAGDLLLGLLHYRQYIDPASGWAHHIIYSGLVYKLSTIQSLSLFLICGGVLEVSTIILAASMMFPYLREDFWFPITFFMCRIVWVTIILHEVTFNHPTTAGGPFLYFLALLMHINWFVRYWKGRQRRMLKEKKLMQEKEKLEKSGASLANDGSTIESSSSSVSVTKTTTTFQLRVKKK